MATCNYKHCKYQPTDEEFKCPKCEALVGDFCIDESLNYDCELLHEEDYLICYGKDGKGCPGEYHISAKTFCANLVKKKNLVPCQHCKGTGFVKKGGAS